MGLFDSLLGDLMANEEQHSALLQEVGSVVNEAGGVGGLTQQFEQKGLGGVMSGWISNGGNPPISGQQIIDVLGQDRIAAIAAKAGLSEAQVAAGVSKLLPLVINQLTPNGTVPPHAPADVDAALSAVKSNLAATPPAA
jgi:uncharacterized protein YidB (DUF937 family)